MQRNPRAQEPCETWPAENRAEAIIAPLVKYARSAEVRYDVCMDLRGLRESVQEVASGLDRLGEPGQEWNRDECMEWAKVLRQASTFLFDKALSLALQSAQASNRLTGSRWTD